MFRESESRLPRRSNGRDAQACTEISIVGDDCTIVQPDCWFMRMANALWPKKPAASVQCLTGAKERVSHYYASGQREPPGGILVKLLRGDEGGRVLDHIMAGADAAWWRAYRRSRIVTDAFDAAAAKVVQLELALDR